MRATQEIDLETAYENVANRYVHFEGDEYYIDVDRLGGRLRVHAMIVNSRTAVDRKYPVWDLTSSGSERALRFLAILAKIGEKSAKSVFRQMTNAHLGK